MNIKKFMPLLPLRGMVAFPGMSVSIDVVRDKSQRSLEAAMEEEKELFLVAQRDVDVEHPKANDLYLVGVTARVQHVVKLPGGVSRIVCDTQKRAVLKELLSTSPYYNAVVEEQNDINTDQVLVNQAFVRALQEAFEEYFSFARRMIPENIKDIFLAHEVGSFADAIAANLQCNYAAKQEILELFDVYQRVERLLVLIRNEIQVLKIEKQISDRVKQKMDDNQREYYLREELRIIEQELYGKDGEADELEAYRAKIKELDLADEYKEKLEKEVGRLEKMQPSSADSAVLRNYLDTVLELPWNEKTEENTDINRAREILERDHYGLEQVKERILEHLAVHTLTNGKQGSIICLVGPPGTGKTSIIRSVAEALNRNYVRISLGGIHDEADIRGHRKTYIAAMPGRIISALTQAKSKNPVLLFDELDKMGADFKGDPSAALLEVLDAEQNHAFRDHYIELPFDLSEVLFIATANTLSTIPAPLLDRMEVIELSGYTEQEKLEIAKRYLIPKQLEKNGLRGKRITIEDAAIHDLINYYTRESGVRNLEREIGRLLRKIAKAFLTENRRSAKVTPKTLVRYLGKHKYNFSMMNVKSEIGTVRGLAWTSAGGDTLSVEVNTMPGTGKVELTGKLGDVMKESALTAISCIRARSKGLKLKDDFYKHTDIHIHVPEGAVPKDGPSAGITIATAVASALTQQPVRNDVAMTGEITLRGNVLPIGGLKEKTLAAYRAGIRTVVIPDGNRNDIDDIPENIKEEMQFVPVKTIDSALKTVMLHEGGGRV